ncbi:MAG: ATP-grasp domain-containing protein [Lautropia mirabilis]
MIDGDAALALVCHRNHRMSFVFEAAQAAGIRLVLIYDSSESEPPHGLPGVVGYWRLPVFEDPNAALKEFVDGAETRGIGGVMTLREEAIIWTAEAARRLGTPGIPPSVAALVRNKYRMRQALAQAGLRTPAFAHINDPGDISSVESLGFPLVIKPLAGWGSAGVMLARSVEELHERIRTVWAVQERDLSRFYEKTDAVGLVVEQYLPGKEFVAECFVDGDGVHVMAVGDKGHPQGPWFEETIYRLREDLDSVQVMALREAACAGVKALGITMGAAHVEMRLDAEGLPYVIEIGARIGGSGVSHFIVEQGTGVSLAELCMLQALGLPTSPLPDALPVRKVSANYIIPLRGEGRFCGFIGMDAVRQHPETARVLTFFEPGHIVPPPPAFGGYPGFIFSVHPTQAAARSYHRWLDDTLCNEWEDVSP